MSKKLDLWIFIPPPLNAFKDTFFFFVASGEPCLAKQRLLCNVPTTTSKTHLAGEN